MTWEPKAHYPSGVIWLLATAVLATSPKLHLRLPEESCVGRSQLEPSLSARLPNVSIAADGQLERGDRVVVIAAATTGFHLEVQDAGGNKLLTRELPSDCGAVSELAAAVLDRHFAEVSWPEDAPELSLPAEAPPVIVLPPAPIPWSAAAFIGVGFNPVDAPLGFAVEGWGRRRWLQLGAQLTLGLRESIDVRVDGRARGELLSQPASGAAFAAACWAGIERAHLCGGPLFGATVIFAGVSGELYQRTAATFVRAAPGGTASFDYAVTPRLLIGARASALFPLSPVRLFIEGVSTEKTHSVQALAAVNVGWSFL